MKATALILNFYSALVVGAEENAFNIAEWAWKTGDSITEPRDPHQYDKDEEQER